MLHEDPAVKKKWEQKIQEAKDSTDENSNVQCAITGEYAPIARIHNKIKGVYGGQASGTGLVTFNNPSENSHLHHILMEMNNPITARFQKLPWRNIQKP